MDDADLLLGWPLGISLMGPMHKQSPLDRARARGLQRAIRYADDRHLLTFAPTGSGKGVGVIIPNLLSYPGPAIVIDPKGENFAVTARYRKTTLRQEILLLDPFQAVNDSELKRLGVQRRRLNPIDVGTLLDNPAANEKIPDNASLPNQSIDTEAQMLADIFGGTTPAGENKFWDVSAKRLISALIAHEIVVARREHKTPLLSRVVSAVFSDNPPLFMAKLLDEQSPSGFVRSGIGGGLLAIQADVTRAGIISTAQSHLSLFNSPELLSWLDNSNISLSDIQLREDYTLYIVIPPTKLASHSTLLKAWVAVLMHAIMERRSKPSRRTLFILDECANLGELEVLRKAVTLLRGYGLQVWMFFQDLAQLTTLYKDAVTIINNCGVVQAFGVGRLSTSAPIAKIIGSLTSKQLLGMDERQQVISTTPGKPQIARLLRYYSDLAFKGRFDRNPLIPEFKARSHPSVRLRFMP